MLKASVTASTKSHSTRSLSFSDQGDELIDSPTPSGQIVNGAGNNVYTCRKPSFVNSGDHDNDQEDLERTSVASDNSCASRMSDAIYDRWSYLKENLYDDQRSSRVSRCSRASNRASFRNLVRDLQAGLKPEGEALRYQARRKAAARKKMKQLERVVSVDLPTHEDALPVIPSSPAQVRSMPTNSPSRDSRQSQCSNGDSNHSSFDGNWPASPATIIGSMGILDSASPIRDVLGGRLSTNGSNHEHCNEDSSEFEPELETSRNGFQTAR